MGRTRCAGEGLRRSEHAVTQIPDACSHSLSCWVVSFYAAVIVARRAEAKL